MNSLETPLHLSHYFKKKIVLLGGTENYKDEFQKKLSSNCLPIETKQNIGVNISKIEYPYEKNERFEFLLWNIDCRQPRAYLRTIFYNGAEAIVIFIAETRVDQILQYFNEIQARMSSITLIFCIILHNFTKEEIIKNHFKKEDFYLMIESNDVLINEISSPSDILDQISSISIKRSEYKELENVYIIDFVPLNFLFSQSDIIDDCNDYYEPENRNVNINQIINREQLVKYISNLKLDVHSESANWIKIKNKKLGTFSIYLKNGNVYYFPKMCERCKHIKCLKLRKAPFFICIEAGESKGWTNIKGFDQSELLILAKMLALQEGNENNLPRSVMKQIMNNNICEKVKK